ncbi:pirin family protein [Halobacterium salinarum]|uniref:pirin family protein n=1 Tax=Halobacterium salinarum TaxID=2242 RepID=UPI002A1BC0FB|nr:pirin family protein [Halobacterium salinarum]MCF2240052.1 pirin family protein [Halobacterium salinarum]
MQVSNDTALYKAPRTDLGQNQGMFRMHTNYPGRLLPDHDDHGYGPLARVDEAILDPDTFVGMHPHQNDEIVSYVPTGVMRHRDRAGNELVMDSEHLMVMNAGREFWHEEQTLADDPQLRLLQIFVRPHTTDLEPNIQQGPVPDPVTNEWRHLFGPEESDAPFYVRNDVNFYDVHLDVGTSVELPSITGWDTYFYVFEGAVEANETTFGRTEQGLLVGAEELTVTAQEETLLVAFLINPDAPLTYQGTIGR